MREEVPVACNRGHHAADARTRGHVCFRGQTGGGNRVAGTFNTCHAGIGQMRECASAVLPFVDPPPSRPFLTLHAAYHIPPRRSCRGHRATRACRHKDACAAVISSIDDATLSQMKTGLTVSPRPRRVLAVACTRSSTPSACE